MGRFCSQCGTWHEQPGPRCAHHETEHAAPRNAARLARRRRDGRDTAAWQRTRQLVLARDNHTCTSCGSTTQLTVHRIPGGHHDNDPNAYTTLCSSCHGRTHRHDQITRGGVQGTPYRQSPRPRSPRTEITAGGFGNGAA